MAQVFLSYSRKDKDFVRQLNEALVAQKREAWVDWKDIPLTAEWQQEILLNIETAEHFVFVISPESAASPNCRREIDHAVANNKRMVPIFRRYVPDEAIPEALRKFQRIDFTADDNFDAKCATLIAALDTDLAWVNAHTRLLTRAKEWEREGRDDSFLLRGNDLREAEHWVVRSSEKDPKPTTLQSQYILASRHSATKRQRNIIEAVVVALVVAIGLAIYALVEKKTADANAIDASRQKDTAVKNEAKAKEQEEIAKAKEDEARKQQAIAEEQTATAQRNARESKARELSAFATESLRNDAERSILLGMEAVNATLRFGQPPVPAAEEALHEAILSSQIRISLRHVPSYYGLAFSPDGSRLATGSEGDTTDHTAKVWDAMSGKVLLTLRGHSSSVTDVVYSPDGKHLATTSYDATAKVWDAETGNVLLTVTGHTGSGLSVAWSPDGKRLATASYDETSKVWDMKVWDIESGLELRTLRGFSDSVDRLAFSPDGKRIFIASRGSATIWDAEKGKELFTSPGDPLDLAFSTDGKRLAIANWHQGVKVLDAQSGAELLTLSVNSSPSKVAYSPDGNRLAIFSSDNTVRIWDAKSGQERLTLIGTSNFREMAYSPDGKRLATLSSDDCLKFWDAESARELLTLDSHSDGITSLAYSRNGGHLATTSKDGTARVWDAESGRALLTLLGHSGALTHVAYSPDGKRLATASQDGTARAWDAERGEEVWTRKANSGTANTTVVYSPDGKRLATASSYISANTVGILDAANGNELLTLRGHFNGIFDVAFSPDGRNLATVSMDQTAKVWDAVSGKQLFTLVGPGTAVTYSPDGKRLATANWDDTAKVWDAVSGKELLTLHGHTALIVGIAFSPDAERIATASKDGTAKVWSAETGAELLTLRGHSGAVTAVVFTPDGKRLATAGEDGTVQVYALDVRELLNLARSRVTRTFTPKECQRYFQGSCPRSP